MSRLLKLTLAGLLSTTTAWMSAQELDPNSVVNAAAQVVKMVDDGRLVDVWEGGSAVMKKVAAKTTFVAAVGKAREPFAGGAARRVWIDVSRRDSPGTPELPVGAYMNVGYVTTFANGRTARELVSFRLDDDQKWRVAGYVIH
jgi:hypothetical protein